jgi:hypothetical protein
LATAASRDHPAVALTQAENAEVGSQQRKKGLFDRNKVAQMGAEEVSAPRGPTRTVQEPAKSAEGIRPPGGETPRAQ